MDMRDKYHSIASCKPLTVDLACNLGMCPDGELNQQTFSLLDDAQPTEPHLSGLPQILVLAVHSAWNALFFLPVFTCLLSHL